MTLLPVRVVTPAGHFPAGFHPNSSFQLFCRRPVSRLLAWIFQTLNFNAPALAVIDGSLCQLNRDGGRATGHVPLATAIVEFRRGPLRYYVREHPFGLLPGLPNLYCLDAAFRLQWMAEGPDPADPCTSIVGEEGDALVAQAASGAIVHLDPVSGRLLGVAQAAAVAS